MSGKVAAARAFLTAGNTKRALEYLEEALKDDPEDSAALDAYCDTLRNLERFEDVERIARDWLARSPNNGHAHVQLIVTLFSRSNARGARLAMDAFREAVPWDLNSHNYLETIYQARFVDAPKGLDSLAERARRDGDKKTEFRFASYAAAKRNNLDDAIMEGEFARRTGEDSAEHAAYLAMLYFRTFRMGKCRKYAREALTKKPGAPVPTELICLSWLVLFPPFFVAHLCMLIWTKWSSGSFGGFILGLLLAVIAILLVVITYNYMPPLMARMGLPYNADASLWLFIAWGLYFPLIGAVATLFTQRKPKEIRLSDY